MKAVFVIVLTFYFVNSAHATNYYFSSVSGDDARSSTQAKNPSTPWKSLAKLNSIFSSLNPGDSLLLKRGETFYGSITIKKSGSSKSPIVIGAFGIGNKPVITSLITLTNWVSTGNGIWEVYDSSLGTSVNIVLLNGASQQIGRYPNADAPNGGYLYFESHIGKTSITDNEFPSKLNWKGATLVLRSRRWVLDRDVITSTSGTTISYTTGSIYEPYDNQGYFIQNDLRTLDKFGEWYYNPVTKKLSVFFGTANPSSYNIQASTLTNLIITNKYSYIVVDNLNIKGSNNTAININGGSNFSITNSDILFSGQDGIVATNHTKIDIENNTITNTNNNAINLGYSSSSSTVKNNNIVNTAIIPGMGMSGDGNGNAIFSYGNNNLFESNNIKNTGYVPITFTGNDVTIKNNFIDSFCLTKDDGAGIYSSGTSTSYKRRYIIGNIILDGMGAGFGTCSPKYLPASAIYMDNNASAAEITGNTLANCNNYGIYIHNSFGMVINNNTVYNNKVQVNMSQNADNVPIRNTIITNNIFFSKLAWQPIASLSSSGNDIGLFGTFDDNYYARPLNEGLIINTQYHNPNSSGGINETFDLDSWKKKYGEDKNSSKTAKQIAPYTLQKLIGSNKISNQTFDDDISGVSESLCNTSQGSSGKLDGNYLQVTPTDKGSTVYMRVGSLTAGKNYILRYSVRSSVDSSMIIGAFLRQALSPYLNLTSQQNRKIDKNRSEYELLFTSATDEASATVVFKVDEQSVYYLDNIRFYEAAATITNPDDSIRFEYNPTSIMKNVTLNGNYIDAANNRYSNVITLDPYSSAVLIRNTGNVNIAPTVNVTSPANKANLNLSSIINITANAVDVDGFVKKVDFYNGSKLLGTDNTPPYSFAWNNVPAGNYTITAKATDDDGSITTSAPISFSVIPNIAPTVSITDPISHSIFSLLSNVDAVAVANDADGFIQRVEFYNGSTLIKTEYKAPYTCTLSNLASGSYTITAKAYDNDSSLTISSPVTFSIASLVNVPPVVSIITPSILQSFKTSSTIRIEADASDFDGSITQVDFYNGSTWLKTEYKVPYTCNLQGLAPGTYTLTAKATDNNGSVTTSIPVPIIVTGNLGLKSASPSIALSDNQVSDKAIDNNDLINSGGKISSTSALNKLTDFRVSPNPAVSTIQIDFGELSINEKVILTIQNSTGAVVKRYPVSISGNKINVDISSLTAGIYLVNLSDGNINISKKFLKVN